MCVVLGAIRTKAVVGPGLEPCKLGPRKADIRNYL